ncbi:MAG: carboxypeptidase-like regulatory domain-containing protein, partial [Vicinamibacterales bacterium]
MQLAVTRKLSNSWRRNVRALLLCVCCLFLAGRPAAAQTASLIGAVTDESKGAVPGVTLTITNVATGVTWEAVSNDQGQYAVPFLPSGSYTVRAVLQGFQSVVRENLVLETDQQVRVDLVLKPATVTEEVDVIGTAPVLNSDTSSVGQVVTGKSITDLPLNGRDFLQLAYLAPGVMQSGAGDRATDAFVANGARSILNSFMLDGVDNNARIVDQQNNSNVVSKPSVDALAEFSIQTNNFSAEHGQAAGALI